MKKIYLLFSIVLLNTIAFAQSFSGPTSVASGSTFTLTGVGESYNNNRSADFYYFTNIISIPSDQITYPIAPGNAAQYIHISLNSVQHYFDPLNQTPTTFKIDATNTYYDPITVTFKIPTQYAWGKTNGTGGITGSVYVSYTVTIQPVPGTPHPGTFARLIATKVKQSPTDTDPYSGIFDISVYFYQYSNLTGPLNVSNLPINYHDANGRGVHDFTVNASGTHFSIGQIALAQRVTPPLPTTVPTASSLGFTLNLGTGYTIYYN